jgi:hypothetical protein
MRHIQSAVAGARQWGLVKGGPISTARRLRRPSTAQPPAPSRDKASGYAAIS